MDCWRPCGRRAWRSIPSAKTPTTAGLRGLPIPKGTRSSCGSRRKLELRSEENRMEPERHKCTACGGTGDCPVCKGTSNGGQCTQCAGTGRCPNCGGTGRNPEKPAG